MIHPGEQELALLAGGETGPVRRFVLGRHLRNCEDCQERVAEFRELRERLGAVEAPDVNWDFLAAEMRANIRVGLEAGACVRTVSPSGNWVPRFTVAIASMLLVIGASFFLTDTGLHRTGPNTNGSEASAPVLQATSSGIELRKGTDSFTLTDPQGVRADRSVSAQGMMEERYVNGDTGSVTITNVYLQQ